MNSTTDLSERCLDIIEKAYTYDETEHDKRSYSPCRIRFRGRYIQTNAHRVWKRVGDAKNALRQLVGRIIRYSPSRFGPTAEEDKIYADLLKEVVFEPVSVDWVLRHR